MPRKTFRKYKGTIWQHLLLEKMPRQLVQDAKVKCQEHRTTLRDQIASLLTTWTYHEDNIAFVEEDDLNR